MSETMKYPNNLKNLRTRSEKDGGMWLSQQELGKLVGVDITTVCKHEAGDRQIERDLASKYAKVLKCTVYDIFVPHGAEQPLFPEGQQ